MREAQEREAPRLSLATLLPVLSGEPPKLDQPRLIRMEFQTELGQTLLKLSPEENTLFIYSCQPALSVPAAEPFGPGVRLSASSRKN